MTATAPPTGDPWRLPATDTDVVRWPDEFGRRYAIFVDVEEEFDWDAPFSARPASVTAIVALPRTHERLVARGAAITYLVDHPVATDRRAIEILRAIMATPGTAIGTQLHPWVNPPHEEIPSIVNSFVGNLPIALQAAKIDALTDAIVAAFGVRPLAFRAGRYGLGADTLALLAARGYRLDTSMRAAHDYSALGGPDYRAIGNDAFRAGPGGAMIELPLTTVFTGRLRGQGAKLHRALGRVPRGRGLAARAGLLSRVPLSPEGTPVGEALEAIRAAVGDGVRLLNLSFHSPSLVLGNTPYVRDAADLAAFDGWWDRVFDLFDRLGVRAASLDDILAAGG